MKYKYSRKQIVKCYKNLCPLLMQEELLTQSEKKPKPTKSSIEKCKYINTDELAKCKHKHTYYDEPYTRCAKCDEIMPVSTRPTLKPTKSSVGKCNHDKNTICLNCAKPYIDPSRPTLKPIEGLDWKYLMDNEDILENLILVQKWFKGVTNRINLLTDNYKLSEGEK